MVGVLIELKDVKWLLRIGLTLIFGMGLYMESRGISFFQDLAEQHATTSSILIFLCVIGFLQPFIKVKSHDKHGGEFVLKKISAVAIILVGAISVLLYLAVYQPGMIGDALTASLGEFGVYVMSVVTGIQESSTYQLYGFPIGLGAGALILWGFAYKLWPRIHKVTAPQKQYQGAPDYTKPSVIPQPNQPVPQQPIAQKVEA
jgi:hypothetical protein